MNTGQSLVSQRLADQRNLNAYIHLQSLKSYNLYTQPHWKNIHYNTWNPYRRKKYRSSVCETSAHKFRDQQSIPTCRQYGLCEDWLPDYSILNSHMKPGSENTLSRQKFWNLQVTQNTFNPN